MTLPQELLGGLIGFCLSAALLSFLIGDNPLYRVALHLFIGLAMGYGALIVIYDVLLPRLVLPLAAAARTADAPSLILAAFPLLIGLLLALRLHPRTAGLGGVGVAFLAGVGAAVALGGAIRGTLLPQIAASWAAAPFFTWLLSALSTVLVLLAFQYWVGSQNTHGEPEHWPWLKPAVLAGRGLTWAVLGFIYGGMILTGLAALGASLGRMAGWLGQFSGLLVR